MPNMRKRPVCPRVSYRAPSGDRGVSTRIGGGNSADSGPAKGWPSREGYEGQTARRAFLIRSDFMPNMRKRPVCPRVSRLPLQRSDRLSQ